MFMKNNYFVLCGILSIIIIFTFFGCQRGDAAKKVATVDGQHILLNELTERIEREISLLGDRTLGERESYDLLKQEILNTMIDEKVMLLRARELSLFISDEELSRKIEEIKANYTHEGFARTLSSQNVDFDIWKEELKNRMLMEKLIAMDVNARVTVTEDEARAYYKSNRKKYERGKRIHVAQIIVRDEKKAQAILNRLKRGEEFAKVAREESIGPEAARGGDLGFITQGVMPEETERFLFSQPPGSVSEIIKSSYGYHIVKILEKEKRRMVSWQEIKELVMADVKKEKEEKAYAQWLEDLRSKATVRIDRTLLKTVTPPGHQAE